MVRGRVGVGVTMLFSDAPFADGAGDDSAVLDSKTSPETQEEKKKKRSKLHPQFGESRPQGARSHVSIPPH